jgi:hypothetical protein
LGTFAFLLLIAGSQSAAAQKVDCSSRTDEQIVREVYARIKEKYPSAVKNINVVSTGGVVKLQGWVANEKTLKKIESIVKKTKCVKQVVNELSAGKTGGCGPGQKECGGACIPEKDPCNVCLSGDPSLPGCNVTTTTTKTPKDQ